VGGSLWFIRLPFIIEGMIYGLIGALISTLTLSLISYYVLVVERNSNAVTFVYNLLGGLKWPSINFLDVILGVLAVAVLGALIGAFNSIVAIRRYIN
ncbi:MAG TPA: ABC transporter permease, partial [Candidatus Dojkabacteria bacterium]|nr:ABC transporter permease [Candidatus Dojkabacteria bacterium]